MKKFVVLSLISFLILAFGATVYGQEKAPAVEIKVSGFIDTQTMWLRNVFNTPGPIFGGFGAVPASVDKTNAWLESRGRLKFDAIMGKELSGTIFLEMDSSRWGELSPAADQRNAFGVTSTSADRGAVEVKNVYFDFGVPVIPIVTTVRVGLQPLGIRPDLVLTTDGMGVTIGLRPVDPLTVALIWGKWYEGQDHRADDMDAYALTLAYKIQALTIGAYGLYMNMNSYPVPTAVGQRNNTADFYWVGAYLDGKLGPVNAKLDFVYDDGKVESRTAGVRDVDYSGWVGRVAIDFPWEKFNFGAKFMYASGADARDTNNTGLPGGTNDEVESYVIPPSSEEFGAFGESLIFYGTGLNRGTLGYFTAAYSQAGRGAIGGTWMAKLYAAFKIFPEWKTTIEALYIGDTTDNGNTVSGPEIPGVVKDEDDIGIEVDWINEFTIYKNLIWKVGLGWLFAGDAFEVGGELDDPWIVTTNITYTF
jgi:hypothetical protein